MIAKVACMLGFVCLVATKVNAGNLRKLLANPCGDCSSCVAVSNPSQGGISDAVCAPCAAGQTWWPCNVAPAQCECGGDATAAPTPVDSTHAPTPADDPNPCSGCANCVAVPNPTQGGISDAVCAPCADEQTWWPCNVVPAQCECGGYATSAPTLGESTDAPTPQSTDAPTLQAATLSPTPSGLSVPCVFSKTGPYWAPAEPKLGVVQAIEDASELAVRCKTGEFIDNDQKATCVINSHGHGYDYDKITPDDACPYPKLMSPTQTNEQCKAQLDAWIKLGVKMVELPNGIQAMTAIGHGVLDLVRGECALLEFNGRFAAVLSVDIRSFSMEFTLDTLLHLTGGVEPGGHCFVPQVSKLNCNDVIGDL